MDWFYWWKYRPVIPGVKKKPDPSERFEAETQARMFCDTLVENAEAFRNMLPPENPELNDDDDDDAGGACKDKDDEFNVPLPAFGRIHVKYHETKTSVLPRSEKSEKNEKAKPNVKVTVKIRQMKKPKTNKTDGKVD